jgi:hypothetical protein
LIMKAVRRARIVERTSRLRISSTRDSEIREGPIELVVSWRTQEVLAYRDLKTNEITVGDENKIQQVG